MDTHEITVSHQQNMVFEADINGNRIVMDSPEDHLQSTGASPKRLMLAALAGCTGVDVVSILQKMKVPFSNLSIDIAATLTNEHPRIYKAVMVTYHITMASDHQNKMEKAVTLSKEKYCGVMAMFAAFSQVTTQIMYTNKD
ncbi:MAG: OsmC family protein [Ferruginibacter sp.]